VEAERAGPSAEAGPAPVEVRGADDMRTRPNRPGRGTGRRRREKIKSNYQFDFPRIKNPLSKGEIYMSLENEAQVKSQNRCIVKK